MTSLINDRLTEALVILAEECCEVGQIVAKIHRWGLGSTNNMAMPHTNRDELVKELGDVLALIRIVQEALEIDDQELEQAVQTKMHKLKIYSRYL